MRQVPGFANIFFRVVTPRPCHGHPGLHSESFRNLRGVEEGDPSPLFGPVNLSSDPKIGGKTHKNWQRVLPVLPADPDLGDGNGVVGVVHVHVVFLSSGSSIRPDLKRKTACASNRVARGYPCLRSDVEWSWRLHALRHLLFKEPLEVLLGVVAGDEPTGHRSRVVDLVRLPEPRSRTVVRSDGGPHKGALAWPRRAQAQEK